MKIRDFNSTYFIATIIIVGLLSIPSCLAAAMEEEGILTRNDTFWYSLAQLFYLITFPSNILFSKITNIGGPFMFSIELIVNCIVHGLIVERITFLVKKAIQ